MASSHPNVQIRSFIKVLLFIFLGTAYSHAADYIQFRGPNRDGIYPETGLLKKWPILGPKRITQISGLGAGYSSPAISGDTIYVTGMADNLEYLFAFDLDGKFRWKKEYGNVAKSYPAARSTPTITDDAIYLTSGAGEVVCFDKASGDLKWSVAAYEKFRGRHGRWGIAESALVIGNKVIFTPGGLDTTMVALDKETGETVWMSKSIGGGTAYASPIIVERGSKTLIVTITDTYMLGVNEKDGAIEWSVPYPMVEGGLNGINAPSPIYHDGRIFFTSGYDHSGVMLDLSEDGSSASIAWVNPDLDNHHGGVVLVDGYLYGSNWINNQRGNWVSLDWETGKTMYEKNWYTKGSIIYADGMLYCFEESKGHLGLVKASPDGFQLVSSFQMEGGDGPFWAHPVIKDGRLYLRHGDVMSIYNIKAE